MILRKYGSKNGAFYFLIELFVNDLAIVLF